MRVVAFVSEVPGSGKTLLAGHVAAQAGAEGVGPVVVLDGDPARGLSEWWAERAAPNPVLGAWDRTCTAEGFKRLAKGGVALVVIDTPSGHTAMAEQAIALADLVVLPTRPNPRDLEAAGAVVNMVEALETPFVFLINHTQGEDDFPTAAVIALAQHGTVCPVILPQRPDFDRCRDGGRTVMDLDPDSPSSEDMARLWDYLSNHMAKVAPATKAERRSEPGDRRRFPRHRYDQVATYSVGDMVFPCHINDISAGGVSISTAEPPVIGTEVTLHVPYLGAFKGETVYAAADRVGLRFLIDERTQGDLVKQLSGLLHGDQHHPEADAPEPGEAEPGEAESPPRTAAG